MISLHKNKNGDTRTADKKVTFEEFQTANDLHIVDVFNVMNFLSELLSKQGDEHDWTKKVFEEEFYQNFLDTLKNEKDFVSNTWYAYIAISIILFIY